METRTLKVNNKYRELYFDTPGGGKKIVTGEFCEPDIAPQLTERWNAHLPLLNALTGHLAGPVPDVVRTQQRDMIAQLLRSMGAKKAIMERLEQWDEQDVIDRFGLSCEPGHVQQLHTELREALDHPQELIDWTIDFNLLQS